MSKVSVGVGEEFPLQEPSIAGPGGGRHWRHHHNGHRRGRHRHGAALFFLPVLAAGVTAAISYPLETLAGAGALLLVALVGHGIWHLFRRKSSGDVSSAKGDM